MRYGEFRDQFRDALREEGLLVQRIGDPVETIELATGGRRWALRLDSARPAAEPFHVSAEIVFECDPFQAARAYTCEEDLLTELLGRKRRSSSTAQRFIRVDLELRATLPYRSTTSVPDLQILTAWTASVGEKLHDLFTEIKVREGRITAVMGARREIEIAARCGSGGTLLLDGVSVGAFRLVRVPRVWDDPDRREAEKGASAEPVRLAERFRQAIDEWTGRVAELARWIRYEPPPSEAKRAEPWIEDEEEGADGGPGTIQ